MHILLKYPTRNRPLKFMKNLSNYIDKLSGKHTLTILVTMDLDDYSMNNNPMRYFLNGKIKDGVNVSFSYGESLGKISAINRGIPSTEWDILISTADDMEPVEQGWDDIIATDMAREFPDLNGSLNYNNDPRLEAKGTEGFKTLITLPVIGRKLYERFGYVYHPDYKSEWCDNEQTEVFEKLGVLKHINRRPIIHKWDENQDDLMRRNMHIGASVDRTTYEKRKSKGFDGIFPSKKDMIVQITITRNELFMLKEMLPIWQKYADAFVFMDDCCTDGTYEFLMENASKYNILAVLKSDRSNEHLMVESNVRQRLFDEAYKHSGKIICLDTDEYLDGEINKEQLKELLENNIDTLFYTNWIQYTGKNEIRVDGKWEVHPVDRIGSYGSRVLFKDRQSHGEHLPVPTKQVAINLPHLFVSHLQWLDKKTVAIKQYYWKVFDYVNHVKYNAQIIDRREYDRSVNDFKWKCVPFSYPLQVRTDIYSSRNPSDDYKLQFIHEHIKKHNIPNLNDWNMGIHQ